MAHDAPGLDAFGAALEASRTEEAIDLPFARGWVGWLGYELGAVIEPTAGPAPAGATLARFDRCDAALLYDHDRSAWCAAGDAHAARALVDRVERETRNLDWSCGPLRSAMGEGEYRRIVERAVELIHAGDVFQVNLAHAMEATFSGSARGLFVDLLEETGPDHGALLEQPGALRGEPGAIVSISPELFLRANLASGSDRRVVSRPIKGTRRSSAGARSELLASAKDQSELVMIVDLMRNDLGRVCEFGSVRVESARDLEPHAGGTLLHATATVSGTLRPGTTALDLIRATFPPGSITGAPKVRAMQVIRELEAAARGAYCGAIGCFADHGPATLSVAIRTASIFEGTRLVYPVGAGIVAQSEPDAEWRETLAKAEAFESTLLRRSKPAAVGAA